MNINKLIEGQREEFRRTFFENYGADKIWVSPSKDNVQTVLDIHDLSQKSMTGILIKFLDSEIERLESPETEKIIEDNPESNGYGVAVADQITHLQDIKKQLE